MPFTPMEALSELPAGPSWEQLSVSQQALVTGSIPGSASAEGTKPRSIAWPRAERQACASVLAKAIEDLLRLVDGNRRVRVTIAGFFSVGIDSEEQLTQVLSGLQQRCLELIAAGKKVLVQ